MINNIYTLTSVRFSVDLCSFGSEDVPIPSILSIISRRLSFLNYHFSRVTNTLICKTATYSLIEQSSIPCFLDLPNFDVKLFHKYYWGILLYKYSTQFGWRETRRILEIYSKVFFDCPLQIRLQQSEKIENYLLSTSTELPSRLLLLHTLRNKDTEGDVRDLTDLLDIYVIAIIKHLCELTLEDYSDLSAQLNKIPSEETISKIFGQLDSDLPRLFPSENITINEIEKVIPMFSSSYRRYSTRKERDKNTLMNF